MLYKVTYIPVAAVLSKEIDEAFTKFHVNYHV